VLQLQVISQLAVGQKGHECVLGTRSLQDAQQWWLAREHVCIVLVLGLRQDCSFALVVCCIVLV
jgi:hypothetical protein